MKDNLRGFVINVKDILAMEPFVTEANRQPSKRRKRKSSQSNNAGGNVKVEPGSKKNRSPGPQSFNPMPGVSDLFFFSFFFGFDIVCQFSRDENRRPLKDVVVMVY